MQFSFLIIKNAMNQHLEKMLANAIHLFVADVSKDEMWQTYLTSFPEGTNPMRAAIDGGIGGTKRQRNPDFEEPKLFIQ